MQGRRRAVREGRPGRAARAAGRAPARAADGVERRNRLRRARAARDRGHRRPAGDLCALLLPIPDDAIFAFLSSRPRRRGPPRELRQPRGLPQAAGELAAGHLAKAIERLFSSEIQVRRRPRGRARRGRGPDLRRRHEHRARARRHRRRRVVARVRAAGSRPRAPGARGSKHPPMPEASCASSRTHAARVTSMKDARPSQASRFTRKRRRPRSAPIHKPCASATRCTCRARFRSIRRPCRW